MARDVPLAKLTCQEVLSLIMHGQETRTCLDLNQTSDRAAPR
jgi:hypothetical protein